MQGLEGRPLRFHTSTRQLGLLSFCPLKVLRATQEQQRRRASPVLRSSQPSDHDQVMSSARSSQHDQGMDNALTYSTLMEDIDSEEFVVQGVVTGVVSSIEPNQAEVRLEAHASHASQVSRTSHAGAMRVTHITSHAPHASHAGAMRAKCIT